MEDIQYEGLKEESSPKLKEINFWKEVEAILG